MSCVIPKAARTAAQKVLNRVKEQSEKSDLSVLLENAGQDPSVAQEGVSLLVDILCVGYEGIKQEEVLDNVRYLTAGTEKLMTCKLPKTLYMDGQKESFEHAEEVYNRLIQGKEDDEIKGAITVYNYGKENPSVEEFEDIKNKFRLKFLSKYGGMVDVYVRHSTKTLVIVVKKPYKDEALTPQEKAVSKLNELSGIKYTQTGVEVQAHGKKPRIIRKGDKKEPDEKETGRKEYVYNGKTIIATPITTKTNHNKEYTGPILAGPLGNAVDAIGRWFFDIDSPLWKKDIKGNVLTDADGNPILVDATALQTIIDDNLRGLFSIKGLKNLIEDFRNLKEVLEKEFGKDTIFITKPITLVSQEIRQGKLQEEIDYTLGIPDLLAVDSKGKVHVLDFKTRVTHFDNDDYTRGFGNRNPAKPWQDTLSIDEKIRAHSSGNYINQVSHEIRMLQSLGFDVDQKPYLVMADTYYETYDRGEKTPKGSRRYYNVPSEKENSHDVITLLDKEGKPTSKTLAKYAEDEPASFEEGLNEGMGDRKILYIEPRLHVKLDENKKWTPKLDALRSGEEELPFNNTINYVSQVMALPKEDRELLEEIAGKAIEHDVDRGMVRYSEDDARSNPELLPEDELQFVADTFASQLSEYLQRASDGEMDYLLSGEGYLKEGESLKGKSRAELLEIVGINYFIDLVWKRLVQSKKMTQQGLLDVNNLDELWALSRRMRAAYPTWETYLKKVNLHQKAMFLDTETHKRQVITMSLNKLRDLEPDLDIKFLSNTNSANGYRDDETGQNAIASINPNLQEDLGSEDSNVALVDAYLSGETYVADWMIGKRNFSPKASLSQRIRRVLGTIRLRGKDGTVFDKYGWDIPTYLDATEATQTLLDLLKNCETWEQMEKVLRAKAASSDDLWVGQLLEKLEADSSLKKEFFSNFRKDFLSYSICEFENGQPVLKTRVVNMRSAFETMRDSLEASFRQGKVGVLTVKDKEGKTIKIPFLHKDPKTGFMVGNTMPKTAIAPTVFSELRDQVIKLRDINSSCYKNAKAAARREDAPSFETLLIQEYMEKGVIKSLTSLLHAIGILVPENLVLNYISANTGTTSLTSAVQKLTRDILAISDTLKDVSAKNKPDTYGHVPMTLYHNAAFGKYKELLLRLQDYAQESVESSIYQGGKTYYSYSNPSKLLSIIRNLKDITGSIGKENSDFGKYIERNFGRYVGWFKSVDGDWLNDLLYKLASTDGEGTEARNALSHKVELSFLGVEYKEMGPLTFLRSRLANFFNNTDNPKNSAWFAIPTMSNKPTNEFIRLLLYGSHNEIIDNVLMNTFVQECNRIADVLFYYSKHSEGDAELDLSDKKLKKAGFSAEEISELKNRIENKELTAKDVVRLSRTNSGAKFHFLWYLNNEMASSNVFAEIIAEKLNSLLTDPEDKAPSLNRDKEILDTVRQVISDKMEEVVRGEMEEFEKIGLFDKETVYVKRGKKSKKVERFRYYEELPLDKSYREDSETLTDEEILKRDETAFRAAIENFIWQSIAANINIIQITGGDLAYYGNSVNYQKRNSQMHSPGLHFMHDETIDDGYLRSVHISDAIIESDIIPNVEAVLNNLGNTIDAATKASILNGLREVNVTDGQSYNSPTSLRKKLKLMGRWSDELETAYNKIKNGEITPETLKPFTEVQKPFVTSQVAKYSGSPTMALRRVPIQDKNSEYLIILADALIRKQGKRSKLTAIFDFMEATHKAGKFGDGRQGIDTVHFASVSKVGTSRVIDIDAFDNDYNGSDEDYNAKLTEYLLKHVTRYDENDPNASLQEKEDYEEQQKLLEPEELYYNSEYVDTFPLEDYIIQQEVPTSFIDEDQLFGSQIRILGVSDITPGISLDVRGQSIKEDALIKEYFQLHADNIQDSFNSLMVKLGFAETIKMKDGKVEIHDLPNWEEMSLEQRKNVYFKLEALLLTELTKDAKFDSDLTWACSLINRQSSDLTQIDFTVPLFDPIQSKRIQNLLHAIIKKTINKQRILGGHMVQVTAYDENLHIRFKKKGGGLLETLDEYTKKLRKSTPGLSDSQALEKYKEYIAQNQDGIAYYECYMPIPDKELEKLIVNKDGSIKSIEEIKEIVGEEKWEEMSKVIGYRIPTEDKYSMIPLKIVGFVPRASGQHLIMPKEITYFTGSDFDIDKIYCMFKSWYTRNKAKETTERFVEESDTKSNDANVRKRARDNRIFDLLWGVLTNADTASKMLNPGNFNEQKRVGRFIKIVSNKIVNPETKQPWTWEDLEEKFSNITKKQGIKSAIDFLDSLLESGNSHNMTLPSSTLYFQNQNMQGSQMVGIFANNNVSHAFVSMYNIALDLNKEGHDNSINIAGHLIGQKPTAFDSQRGFDGELISKTIASFLAASVDTAKDPTLSDMNINTATGSIAMILARLGYNTEAIGVFMAQPVLIELSAEIFKNKAAGIYSINAALNTIAQKYGMDREQLKNTAIVKDNSLSLEKLKANLTKNDEDTNRKILVAFNQLLTISYDVKKLTAFTKFNSVTNAAGPSLEDTLLDREYYTDFTDNLNSSVFYEPKEKDTSFNSVNSIVENPLLNAFWETTVAQGGAVDTLCEPFFPHYFPGFQSALKEFKTKYAINEKLSPALYNLLVNDYIYFCLTYENADEGIKPVIPTSEVSKNYLVKDIIRQYRKVQTLLRERGIYNALMDDGIGNACLRVRNKDAYILQDLLYLNSGQLSTVERQKLTAAWTALSTMNDPRLDEDEKRMVRNFGVNLFFYSLMKNGFKFNAKNITHMASVLLRFQAIYDPETSESYIEGLRHLNERDRIIKGKAGLIERFCKQFMQNHSATPSMIKKIYDSYSLINPYLTAYDGSTLIIEADKNNPKDSRQLYYIKSNKESYAKFILYTTKENGVNKSYLYELKEQVESDEDKKVKLVYSRIPMLGITNNFIEYNANEDITSSYFEDFRGSSDDNAEEVDYEQHIQEDIDEENDQSERRPMEVFAIRSFLKKKDRETYNKEFLKKLENAYTESQKDNSEIATAFRNTIQKIASEYNNQSDEIENTFAELRQNDIFKQINTIEEDQNSCFK